MGREAICECNWAGTTAKVKVLLESTDLILRGDIRKRVPIRELRNVEAHSGWLRFNAGRDNVQILLGTPAAEKWADAIRKPPPTLARKLGITNKSIVRTIGDITDEALKEALAEAAQISSKNPDLIVACVDTPESLAATYRAAKPQLLKSIPIWLVYPKGPGHSLNESAIRSLLRNSGMMDTKVASVSSRLTALRFNLRSQQTL
jgi:hypothetical protein